MKNLLNMNTADPPTQVQQPSAPQPSAPQADGSTDPNQVPINPAVRGSLTNLTNSTKAPVFGAIFK